MSELSAAVKGESWHSDHQRIALSPSNLSSGNPVNMEVGDDDEEEDLDFNPFLREETPSDASSSLTSENEGASASVDKIMSSSDQQDVNTASRPIDETQHCSLIIGKEDENTLMHNRLATDDDCGKEPVQENQGTNCTQQEENLTVCGKSQNPTISIDDEDAIFKRTRARVSLANYTLEELETFLQESDDDGDLQNIDEEEEYRKFLAAVLLDGGDDKHNGQGDDNLDEDENDADFEIEIEEALESDADENIENEKLLDDKQEEDSRRPVTRQKKRLKESAESKKCFLGQPKLPLRPILPYVAHAQVSPLPAYGWQFPSKNGADLANGFTAQQIGQLYCLIHEHVQLLVQVFSVCVLDPSRQPVAVEVQKMITEMVCRREEALVSNKVPYPRTCFETPYLRSSLDNASNQSSEFSHWMPLIDCPLFSILDVAPLRLANSYTTDVTATVVRYRQSHLDNAADKSHLKREPLFPLPMIDTGRESNNKLLGGFNTMSTVSSLSPGQLQPKKSLAATLVESTKKQSVAIVPVDIARLAQRFFPLFNIALFPHKPPLPAVANRVLFTDAEDGLLAMGLMEYNNDWGAIQKHFLPCKSKHQIFVRQKNRSSSKAPENPIKAVRRMKTSPLTIDEKARIYEGLKLFKHDWISVWKFFVPHRDPSLLPRQWRIATGTQKSYCKSEAVKEKRRLYEAKRRKMKALTADTETIPGNEVDNGGPNSSDEMDNENEAYVHEAFLADSSIGRNDTQSVQLIQHEGAYIGQKSSTNTDESDDLHQVGGTKLDLPTSSKTFENTNDFSKQTGVYSVSPMNLFSGSKSKSIGKNMLVSVPQARKNKGARVVKLAPDLPPVNLPPSVRVISRSAFHGFRGGSLFSNISSNATKDVVSTSSQAITKYINTENPGKQLNLCSDGGPHTNMAEENPVESDFQMHPLLFQCPEDQSSYYHQVSRYSFLSQNSGQVDPVVGVKDNINIISYSREAPAEVHTIDFHPLLQRSTGATLSTRIRGSENIVSDVECHQFLDQSDCNLRESVSHSEKENNLDLDFRLYSATDNENLKFASRDSLEHVESRTSYLKHSGLSNSSRVFAQSQECEVENVHLIGPEPTRMNNYARQSLEERNEESLPGIVMEQEELSDSDEASEHVEFEREEMDDSEEDAQPSQTHNQDIQTFVSLGEHQAIDEHSQVHRPRSIIQQGPAQESKLCSSSSQARQDPCHANVPQLKPKKDSGKKDTLRKTHLGAAHARPHQSSKARPKSSRACPIEPRRLHLQTDTECMNANPRKPRKRSAPN
ncbi:uncharacterized protein LOC109715022 [Ananas comosus]|uniref:Uncharacterized protein LOC109715022 n=1 Tax=Ananas comosus TaxID=4615 RepID=A0A6P5FGH9_ANACO|nr:uncharacterized protein LOC109715022 [Ananas comosus]